MTLQTEWLRYGAGNIFTGYAAWIEPTQAPLPTVIVGQEAWGVDEHIEDVAQRFAKAGYFAIAPDLFAANGQRPAAMSRAAMAAAKGFVERAGTGVFSDAQAREAAMASLPTAQQESLNATFTALQATMKQADANAAHFLEAARLARSRDATRGGKVAVVGFCMGGGLAARLACLDPELGAAVIFYGAAPPADQIPKIACPVLGLYGEQDPRVNAGIPDFAAAMQKHGKHFEHRIYPGAKHAFFNDTRTSYHAAASRDAFARTLELLRQNL